jgi:hypothetical protein
MNIYSGDLEVWGSQDQLDAVNVNPYSFFPPFIADEIKTLCILGIPVWFGTHINMYVPAASHHHHHNHNMDL